MALASITGVEIFAAGTFHKGTPEEVTFTEADLDAIVANFAALSQGERPKFEPFVKLGKVDPHKGEPVVFEEGNPAAAVVKNLRRDGKRLLADFADVQPDPAKWIELKVYRKVSAEIDKPPDGEKHPEFGVAGPVLKAVALLGANPPAVKGLKDIPRPTFASKRTRITHFCFAEVNTMDRQGMLDFLASKGVDIALLTDAIPDEVLAAICNAWKAEAPADEEMAEDDIVAPAGVGTAVAPPPVKPPQLLPKSLTAKFAEMERKYASFEAKTQAIETVIDRQTTDTKRQHAETKRAIVHSFCEQAVKDRLLKPAEVECDAAGVPLPTTVLARLLRADHTKKHTFSEGGKSVQKTELELQMDEIKSRQPHTFSERVVAGGKPDLFAKIRADVAKEVEARGTRTGKSLHEKLGLLRPNGMR